ncbi:MAG: hypothetical protein WCS03_00425 [Bacteroidota bacterium]
MKIKSFILVFLLLKIILTLKSDSCKKDEPIIIKEEITNNDQKGSYMNGTSISMYELNSSMIPTWNLFSTQIISNRE